jgi:SAM-dependent methyltransferase
MPMNLLHRYVCSSKRWNGLVAENLPPLLDGVDLGDDVLEIGPGFGATTDVLAGRLPRLTSVEIDEASVHRLRARFGERVSIVHGDGAALPFPDGRFSAVVCFTMLHHVPSPAQQDRLFAEARRVLRPGGSFLAADSRVSWAFRLVHLGDTLVPVEPDTLPDRLTRAGFASARVDAGTRRFTVLATT